MDSPQFEVKRLQERAEAEQAFCCMTEVPTPWPQALCVCRDWVAQNLHRHVEGYHAHTLDGEVVGHLYFAASERAIYPYEIEPGAAVLYCVWVQRRYQGQGAGRALFNAFMQDLRAEGCKGILAEATNPESQVDWQRFRHGDPQIIYESSRHKLLYIALAQSSIKVTPFEPSVSPRRGAPVEIVVLSGYTCPIEVSTQLALLQVAQEFGPQVVLRQETLTPQTARHYGVTSGVFINGRQKLAGGATAGAIRQAIAEEL